MQVHQEPALRRAGGRWQPGRRRGTAAHGRSEAGGARRRLLGGLAALSASALLAVPVALAAAPPQPLPTQRIDMKVLLVGNAGDGVHDAWKAQLERAGVPYVSVATGATLTDAFLADYAANHAKFQAVITAQDPPAAMAATLAKFEETFGIRQVSDNTTGPAHGLNNPTQSGEQGGTTAQLTDAGKAAFPYLKGPVPLPPDSTTDVDVFGYQSTPAPGANFTTLLTGANNASYLGINVRANGTQEMVNTVPGNQFQSHHQLLREGMLGWVTRGVYLGYARNHLGLDIDDIFLPDDKWDAVNNVTDYNATLQMDAQDVEDAITWQNRTGLKLNMVFNMSGITQAGGNALLQAFRANSPATGQARKNAFRWINHTYSHPNLDCTTAAFTARQITQNQSEFNRSLAPVAAGLNDPSELVTGEHSGLANLIPGNPGTIDPPFFVDATAGAAGSGTLADAVYEYAITASTPAGETPASVTTVDAAATGSATLSWESVCKATSYKLYRRTAATATAAAGAWEVVHTSTGTTAFDDDGAVAIAFTDLGAAGTPDADGPPLGNTALKAAHGQNPFLDDALVTGGIRTIASDTSKPYPNPSDSATVDAGAATNHTPGSTFTVGPAQSVPRYPTNLYYNVANRADQLDEYNFIYTPDDPATPAVEGGCVTSATNTCRTTPATWTDYMNSEVGIMLGHVYGNDPRPHYFHQTNIAAYDPNAADTNTATGGTLYAVINTLLNRYEASIDRAKAPLVQLTQDEVARTLLRQNAWKSAQAGVTAYIQDGQVHIDAPAGTQVPLTGTTTGSDYAGTRSGWTTLDGAELVLSPQDPRNTAAPSISGTVRAGATLTASAGTWAGTGTIATSFQWQRSAAGSSTWANIDGATAATYTVPAADEANRLRVVVSAGNWISSVSQAVSAAVTKPAAVPAPTPPADDRPAGNPQSGTPPTTNPPTTNPPTTNPPTPARPRLSQVRLAPRTFAVAGARTSGKGRRTGTTVSWKLDRAAGLRVTVQKRAARANRWRTVGTLRRSARQGAGTLRFSGRLGGKALAPGRYRMVVSATAGSLTSSTKTVGFKVLRA